jgi:hypothetical protein
MRAIVGTVGLLVLCLCVPAAMAGEAKSEPTGITALQESIEMGADGSAKVAVRLTLANWEANQIDLPVNVAKPEAPTAEATDVKVAAQLVKNGDIRLLRLLFDGRPPARTQLLVRFTTKEFLVWDKARRPRGEYAAAYTFTNTVPTTIGRYMLKLLLPEGYGISQVTSSTPRMTGEELEPPYDYPTEGGRVVVNLRSKLVAPGRTAAIAFTLHREGGSPLPVILAGLVVAGLALWFKRDVLTRADYAREGVS